MQILNVKELTLICRARGQYKMKKNVLFIAEIGNNHNGNLERAKRLVDAVKAAGCTVAKFQIRDFKTLYRGDSGSVEDLGVEYTKDLLVKYELTLEQHIALASYCRSQEIEYMCTPWDLKSLEFLENLGVARYKLASADFDNIDLIDAMVKTNKPMILSTGMSTSTEIKDMVQYLSDKQVDFTILHCNSTYPAPFSDIELNYITELKKFCPSVGYSGHERGIAVSLGAVALGAEIIERHITEDRELEGPDHQASLLPHEFAELVKMSRQIEAALGADVITERNLSQGAMLNKENLGKSLVASTNLEIGTKIDRSHVVIQSPGQGLSPLKLKNILGKKVNREIAKDEFLFESDFDDSEFGNNACKFKDFNHPLWGIPVRPHDIGIMHSIFDAEVYEFHISYKDLTRPLPNEDWSFLAKNNGWYAPELFENSKLLDLCSDEEFELNLHNLQTVCDFTKNLRIFTGTNQIIPIVTNIGGFSTHEFKPKEEKNRLYMRVQKGLRQINEEGCEVTIQNMAPFPWHFGGQRYQNIFADPQEIIEFCSINERRITLDTAHLSMYCKHANINFYEALERLIPYTAHLHMSDARGLKCAGVDMGSGDVDFVKVLFRNKD